MWWISDAGFLKAPETIYRPSIQGYLQASLKGLLCGPAGGGLGRDVPVSPEKCPGLPDHLQKMERRNNLHNDSSLKIKTQKLIFF